MAKQSVDMVLKAHDEASKVFGKVEWSLGKFSRSLQNFQRSSGLGMLLRGGIYGVGLTGMVDSLTAMYKAAGEGASEIEVLSRGISGFVGAIPIVGRLASKFKELSDEISGATQFTKALQGIQEYKSIEADIIKAAERSLVKSNATPEEAARQDIINQYKDTADKLSKAYDKAVSVSATTERTKLEEDLKKIKEAAEWLRSIGGQPSSYDKIRADIEEKLSQLGKPVTIKAGLDAAQKARDAALEKSRKDFAAAEAREAAKEHERTIKEAERAGDEYEKEQERIRNIKEDTELFIAKKGQETEELLAKRRAAELAAEQYTAEGRKKIEEALQRNLTDIREKYSPEPSKFTPAASGWAPYESQTLRGYTAPTLTINYEAQTARNTADTAKAVARVERLQERIYARLNPSPALVDIG